MKKMCQAQRFATWRKAFELPANLTPSHTHTPEIQFNFTCLWLLLHTAAL